MISSPGNLAAVCASLSTAVEGRTWFRAVQPQFWQTALATTHTTDIASRFNAGVNAMPHFETLYLAENPMVALFEVEALFGDPSLLGNVVVRLGRVADLTDPAAQDVLGTTAQELTGDWEGYEQRGPTTTRNVRAASPRRRNLARPCIPSPVWRAFAPSRRGCRTTKSWLCSQTNSGRAVRSRSRTRPRARRFRFRKHPLFRSGISPGRATFCRWPVEIPRRLELPQTRDAR